MVRAPHMVTRVVERVSRARPRVRFLLDDITTPAGRLLNFVIIASILLVCGIFVVRTYPLPGWLDSTLDWAEWGIGLLFVVEYLARLWVAEDRLGYLFSLYSLIDLVAILPTILGQSDYHSLRMFRVLRIMRLVRFLETPDFFFGTLKRAQLIVLRIIFTLVSITFVSASLVFQAEREVNPQHFRTFFDGVYFAVVTLTTVGYGDITPISFHGRLVTLLVILSGLVFVPWQVKNLIQTWIVSASKREVTCPVCSLYGHDRDAIFCKRCGARLDRSVTVPPEPSG